MALVYIYYSRATNCGTFGTETIMISKPELVKSSESCLSLLLQLMGWAYDTSGPKADSFSREISALGVVFRPSDTCSGELVLDNTQRRKDELVHLINDILSAGELDRKGAQSLRGRLAFACAQVFGRAGQLALQQISLHACAVPFRSRINAALKDALCFLMQRISTGAPRRVSAAVHHTLYILTDASFDDDQSGGLGGVIFDSACEVLEWFSIMLDPTQVQKLMFGDSQVVIGELEAIAPIIALDLWKVYCKSCHVIFLIDNDGARYSLIRGYSCSLSLSSLSQPMAVRLEELVCLQWFAVCTARVASSSNLADFPSCGKFHPIMLPESLRSNHDVTIEAYHKCVEVAC